MNPGPRKGEASERFTLDGNDALEEHLLLTCRRVLSAVQRVVPPSTLRGLLLGGGYGRGEGGVLRDSAGEHPYNDMEFYVFVQGSPLWGERKFGSKLHALGNELSTGSEVEIEFKITSSDKLRRSPPAMFHYDLVWGHRWLLGNDELLAGCEHHFDATRIPLSEAARLLMNRCSGLLFASDRLDSASWGPEEADFVGRNLAKAQLSFGDAWLTAHGRYHWSCLERHHRLKQFKFKNGAEWAAPLVQHHASGLNFKLHPVRSTLSREALSRQYAELTALAEKVWLWLESRRLGATFESAREYALSQIDKCPETLSLKNRLVNLRAFGLRACLGTAGARYPRERLLKTLPLLLFEREASAKSECLTAVRTALRCSASSFPELVEAYKRLWRRFN